MGSEMCIRDSSQRVGDRESQKKRQTDLEVKTVIDNKKNPYRGFLYSDFFSQKLIFSKFFELSESSSCRIQPSFVVLFQYSKDFKLTFTIFEKNRFFEEK